MKIKDTAASKKFDSSTEPIQQYANPSILILKGYVPITMIHPTLSNPNIYNYKINQLF